MNSETHPKISFFVIDYSHGGGVERVTSDLIDIFLGENIFVKDLVSLYQSNEKPYIQYNENINIIVLNPRKKHEFVDYFYNYFKTEKLDFFIFQGDNMTISLAILEAAEKAGVKAIPQYHGSPYAYFKKYSDAEKANTAKIIFSKINSPFKKRKLKKVIQKSVNGFVCVSEGSANELKNIFKNESITKNINVIRNPLHLKETGFKEKEKVISFVSRLESKHKNAFLMVKAWNLIHKKYPDWTLEIFGEGILKQKMMNFCEEHSIKNIDFKGFSQNINKELAKTSISVSTSNTEGFSMAIAEAILNKNAVAITDSDGGIHDMVKHEISGLISPKNDEKSLAKNILIFIENENLRLKYADFAQKNLQKIAGENIVEKWKKILSIS